MSNKKPGWIPAQLKKTQALLSTLKISSVAELAGKALMVYISGVETIHLIRPTVIDFTENLIIFDLLPKNITVHGTRDTGTELDDWEFNSRIEISELTYSKSGWMASARNEQVCGDLQKCIHVELI